MIVEPYKRLRPVPPRMALLVDAGSVLDEDDGLRPIREAEEALWASLERVQELVRRGEGAALTWRGQPIRYDPDGRGFRVKVLATQAPPEDLPTLLGLCGWRDWLAEYGAQPLGSIAASSMSLLRATLERKLFCTVPQAQVPPFRFTVGGRQDLGPRGTGHYRGDLRLYDLRAAYASRLGSLLYGGYWYRLRHLRSVERLAVNHPVFVRARVTLDGSYPGPLVRRKASAPPTLVGYWPEYPQVGRLQGVWTWQEVKAAEAAGAHVKLLDGWFHVSDWSPFAPWWEAVEVGRSSLPGFAQLLAKATGNSLWGRFVVDRHRGLRGVIRYRKRRGELRREWAPLPLTGGERPAHDLGELLTGLVRAELYGAIRTAGDGFLSAHTDGLWAAGPLELGEGWRVKARADELRLLDPQVLSYRQPGSERWLPVVAGWPLDDAADEFERRWRRAAA